MVFFEFACKIFNTQKKVEKMTIGERIKLLRKGKYSQEKLAELLGVHANTFIKWEHDKSFPTADKLKLLAELLGTTVSYLSGENDEPAESEKVERENKIETNKISDSEFIERLVKSQPMVVYETGNERMLIPATTEGFNFIREMRTNQMTGNLAGVR